MAYSYKTGVLGSCDKPEPKNGYGGAAAPKPSRVPQITPRIAYLHEKLCAKCGRCIKTHYCDAFLQRTVVGGIIPRLDGRNCTGCGLCAQVCRRGALQLYKPEEMLVLVDNGKERAAILRQLGVPHIRLGEDSLNAVNETLTPLNGPDLSGVEAIVRDISKNNMGKRVKRLNKLLVDIVKVRVGDTRSKFGKDQFCLRRNKEELYPETRYDVLHPEGRFIGELLAESAFAGNDPFVQIAGIRAAIWAILIWTDPGQVLLRSPIVSIETGIETVPAADQVPENEKDVRRCLRMLAGKGSRCRVLRLSSVG